MLPRTTNRRDINADADTLTPFCSLLARSLDLLPLATTPSLYLSYKQQISPVNHRSNPVRIGSSHPNQPTSAFAISNTRVSKSTDNCERLVVILANSLIKELHPPQRSDCTPWPETVMELLPAGCFSGAYRQGLSWYTILRPVQWLERFALGVLG